jgi:outer membrane protein OmpA-like peptidoglycan-associated protein
MQISTWLAPLILLATFSTQAWETRSGAAPAQHARFNNNDSFGFSMGFNGNSRNRQHLPERPFVLHGVNFRFDSAELTPESHKLLDSVAARLRETPALAVEIGGHASSEGHIAYNMDLSLRRASAVRNYLVQQGVAAVNLRATGYGELQPLASNEIGPGREINRRVELRRL